MWRCGWKLNHTTLSRSHHHHSPPLLLSSGAYQPRVKLSSMTQYTTTATSAATIQLCQWLATELATSSTTHTQCEVTVSPTQCEPAALPVTPLLPLPSLRDVGIQPHHLQCHGWSDHDGGAKYPWQWGRGVAKARASGGQWTWGWYGRVVAWSSTWQHGGGESDIRPRLCQRLTLSSTLYCLCAPKLTWNHAGRRW